MTDNISAILYLISSIFFILALRGLSSPDSARQGNLFGILGMTIAVGTTLALPTVLSYEVILAGIVIGGGIRDIHSPKNRNDGPASTSCRVPQPRWIGRLLCGRSRVF